jgi:serine/threonine protein kinase
LLERGTMIVGYRIDSVLGEGGMGVVYRATQLSLNRIVALKLLSSMFSDDVSFRERFRREGQLQAIIDHPHIVPVYEAGESDDGLFIAMRLVRGPNLKQAIASGDMTAPRAVYILGQVADALDSAHEVGLIHRDVKPQNVLISHRDHTYLCDFGLMKAPDADGLTQTGQFVGTIDYVSPEQARGESATARSDVYALTGVLYEALTGDIPFDRPSEAAILYAHMVEPPPRLSEHRPDLPAALDEVIARGMAKDADERYATAGELMRDAAAALGVSPSQAPTPGGGGAEPSDAIAGPDGETRQSAVPRPRPASRVDHDAGRTAAASGIARTVSPSGSHAVPEADEDEDPADEEPGSSPDPA